MVDGWVVVVDDGCGGDGVFVVVVLGTDELLLPTIFFSEFVGRIWWLTVFPVEILVDTILFFPLFLFKLDVGIAAGMVGSLLLKSMVETIFGLVPTFSEPLNRWRNRMNKPTIKYIGYDIFFSKKNEWYQKAMDLNDLWIEWSMKQHFWWCSRWSNYKIVPGSTNFNIVFESNEWKWREKRHEFCMMTEQKVKKLEEFELSWHTLSTENHFGEK